MAVWPGEGFSLLQARLVVYRCVRLERNIQSQYLQMDLYEEGYGRKLIEDVLRESLSNPQAGRRVIAEAACTETGRRAPGGGVQAPSPSKTVAGPSVGSSVLSGPVKGPPAKTELAEREARSTGKNGARRGLPTVGKTLR